MIARFLAIFAASVAVTSAAQSKPEAASAKVEQGLLRGATEDGVSRFLAIPFAAPPTGENRWRAPQSAAVWQGARDATHFAANCQQDVMGGKLGFGAWTPEYLIEGPVSEDCLYLNVWTPAGKAGAKLPVLYWIHGGGFVSGGASVPIYDGAALAAQGVVVVTVNYRVGIYGFLAHPELTKEGGGSSGNYGLRDQIAGLEWVRRNIAAFGGDPAKVTIAGQSAGAASVHDLILSPLAKGLFRGAIAQSGSGMGMNPVEQSVAEAKGLRLEKVTGATSLADLRKLTPDQLSEAVRKPALAMGFTPTADGVVMPADPLAAARAGKYNNTPVLTGLVADEGSSIAPQSYRPTDPEAYRRAVRQRFGASADRMLEVYPADTPASSAPALARDRAIASMLAWADERRRSGSRPIYAYLFTHVEPGPDAAKYGVFHSSEIPYVFNTLEKAPGRGFTPQDRTIAHVVGRYWINFVKTGDPNGSMLTRWPALDARMRIMDLGPFKTRSALTADRAMLFQEYFKNGGQLSLF